MVRLRESSAPQSKIQSAIFQFQDGAIKGSEKKDIHKIKTWFQFQDGAIKGPYNVNVYKNETTFQFQDGAIKGVMINGLRPQLV